MTEDINVRYKQHLRLAKVKFLNQIEKLQKRVTDFCRQRDWDQYHMPKDLAIGLVTEASELLEIYRFHTDDDCAALTEGEKRQEVADELADVFFFVLRFAEMNGFDLEEVLTQKMQKNGERYPVGKAKGSNKKYTEL